MIRIRSRHSRRALAIQRSAIAFARGARAGGLDDPHTGYGKNRVERRGELGVPVPEQELQAASDRVLVSKGIAMSTATAAVSAPAAISAPVAMNRRQWIVTPA